MGRTKRLLAIVLAMVMMFAGLPMYGMEVKAAETSGDYEYWVTGNGVEIRGYTGSGGDVTIPSKIAGKNVTSIGRFAFLGCSGLTSVSIPDSVTSIGAYAFRECSSLPSVSIPNSVTSIGAGAFSGCIGLTSVVIPSGVTSLGGSTFPVENPFSRCSSLESIKVNEGNPKYDSRNNCNAIIEKESNTLISGCKATVIPNNVTSIGEYAFSGCSGLMNITIPDNVTSISGYAFSSCSNLKNLSMPDGLTHIEVGAFYGCNSLEKVTIPSGVTCIDYEVFGECTSLKSVTIPNSVTRMEEACFFNCSSLKSVAIPNSVTFMYMPFSGCSSLESVIIPSSVTDIGGGIFYRCDSLASIKVDEGNPKYDSRGDCNAIIETASNTLLCGCKNTVIPDSVTRIESVAFNVCPDLTSIVVSDGVTSIGDFAFRDCSKMTSITLPSSVIDIGEQAFGYYYYDDENWKQKIPNFIIYGESGSAAETYAKGNGFTFKEIPENDLHRATIILEADSYEYDGQAKTPSITVIFKGKTLSLNTDYTVSYSNNIDIGTAKVTITGKGDYEGIVEKPFFIRTDISKVTVTLDESSYIYNGQAKTPSVTVKVGEKTLVLNTDYTVTYSSNINVGTAKVIVSGKAAYTGSIEKTFTIGKADISKATVTLAETSYTYDGKAKTPSVTVKFNGKTLSLNTDYTVSYSNNIDIGTAKVTVTGKGNYTGSKSVNFTITKKADEQPDSSITCNKTLYKVVFGAKPFKINATSKSKLTFTSSKPKIASVDKNTGKVTIKNTGIATITVKAGTKSVKVTVKVSPKKQTVKSAKAVKGKKLTVGWVKDKTASGYQVQISTAKNFKKDVKSKNVSKTSYTFTKLKTGKKYYVRVRSYKKSGKEMLYGDWSKAKQSSKVKN